MLFMNCIEFYVFMAGTDGGSKSSRGWLMTAVSPWGENAEDAFDQGLVELGLGDVQSSSRCDAPSWIQYRPS